MATELQKELDKDQAFIDKVSERIYQDGIEESIPEPEWILEMTDIADKYLMRFKAAENARRKSANKKINDYLG